MWSSLFQKLVNNVKMVFIYEHFSFWSRFKCLFGHFLENKVFFYAEHIVHFRTLVHSFTVHWYAVVVWQLVRLETTLHGGAVLCCFAVTMPPPLTYISKAFFALWS